MIDKTKWFIENSKSYMAGTNPSIYQWVRAYVRFMWFSRKDPKPTKPQSGSKGDRK